jgi:hypothetical protein
MPREENLFLKKRSIFIKNFIAGLGWMTGATLGFALLLTILGIVFSWLGGLPFIGEFIANLIDLTNKALETKRTLVR